MAETNDVNQGSSPEVALENAIASTPEATQEAQQAQETQTPAKEEATQEQEAQEEAKIPYSRLKEVVDEKNWYKQQLERTIQQQPQQQFPQPTQQPQELGNTPEEREFWRLQRQVAREEAEKVAKEQIVPIQRQIAIGAQEFAQQKVREFRQAHSDVKPGSYEESLIAQRIDEAARSGFSLSPDEAYWMVMGQKGIRTAQEQGKQQVKQQIEAKKKANVESSSSVPLQAQTTPKRSFKEDFLRNLQLAEEGKL